MKYRFSAVFTPFKKFYVKYIFTGYWKTQHLKTVASVFIDDKDGGNLLPMKESPAGGQLNASIQLEGRPFGCFVIIHHTSDAAQAAATALVI